MNSSFFYNPKQFYFFFIFLILIIFIFYIILLQSQNYLSNYQIIQKNNITEIDESSQFIWPCYENYRITSYFGKRKAPTSGASSMHSGIDIAATTGTNLVACFDGNVIYTGFKGSGGYTITIENGKYQASYCHVSPEFSVSVGEIVMPGMKIGTVGPKNVYGVANNPYRDSNGKPTNGATTGPHLHFTLKINKVAVNPLDYLRINN